MSAAPSTPVTSLQCSPAAWRGRDFAATHDWISVLPNSVIEELDRIVNNEALRCVAIDHLTREDFSLPSFAETADNIRRCMEQGRGFVCLRGLPVTRWGEQRTRLALWAMGTYIGWAEPQDGAGSLMHDVRDIGRTFGSDDQIRYFQTRQAIELHNDGADIFALCCLAKGGSGGMSRIVSAVEAFNEIVRRRPDLAVVLQNNFYVDARGQRSDGARCQVIPIYAFADGQISILLKLQYIYSAQRFDEVPRLTDTQLEALELLTQVINEPEMALEFTLEPGDMLVASNHVTLHGRTAYHDDAPANDGGRHMLRLWLTIPNGRALPAHYAHTREFASTYARRVYSLSLAPSGVNE